MIRCNSRKQIGRVYRNEPTVCVEFNLDDLYQFQSTFSHKDTFRDDIQDGIDYLEKLLDIQETSPGLSIIVVDNRKNKSITPDL